MDPCRGEYLWYKGYTNIPRRKKIMKKQKVQTVKKVITGLKKASKLHAGQAKVLKKVITSKKS